MNKRIKELAIQAYVAAGYNRKHELFNALLDESAEFHEKFAELFMKECVGIARMHNNSGEGGVIAQNIEQHFGVEE